eukprot:CCRYP_017148-RA/>CCRYP_017148-RA protein AED:0.57 eAED:0.54 QI:0/0/0/1/1/1/2/0/218
MSRSSSTLYRPTTKYKRRRHPTPMTKQQVKQGISGGTIPSAISDTVPLRQQEHSMIHSTPLQNLPPRFSSCPQTLLSGSKFAGAGYTAVCDKDEVNFYDSNKIHVNATSILQGYRCPHTGLWRVPLRQITCNINNDTLILDSPCGAKSLNTKYVVPSTEEIRALLASSSARSSTPSSMSTSSPVSNKLFGTSMPQQVFPPKQHGWQRFGVVTTTLGPS